MRGRTAVESLRSFLLRPNILRTFSAMGKTYAVAFEVAGPVAVFARPDTGGTPTSYPAPTGSAAKGLFESIAFFNDGAAWISPTLALGGEVDE